MKRVSLFVLAALAFLSGCSRLTPSSRSSFPRVLLIGIDGADRGIIDRLIGQGKLPTFARLEREGASGLLKSQEPLMSPIVWTTIATGRSPQDHGVLDFVEVGADGQATPIMSTRRRVPALWNIAGEFGKRSGFVGWYASYPAERVKGFEVSDRMAFHQVRSARATAGATYPEALADDLRKEFGEPTPDVGETERRFVSGAPTALTADGRRRVEELAKIFATSEFYRRILPSLQRKFRTDLLAVYFEGIDACGHLFMEDAPPKRPDVSDADFQAFSQTVDRYYQYQDEVIGELLKLEGPDTVTMVVSDHGFKSGDLRPQTSGRADTGLAPLWHRLHGVVFLHGHSIAVGRAIEGASVMDVAPTVLNLLSIPLSRELVGHPISAASASGGQEATPKTIDKYDPIAVRAAPRTAAPDSEAVAKLMALGYLSGSVKTLAHDENGRTAASYINEGIVRTHAGDFEGALRAYGKASQLDPKNVNALAPAAAIEIRLGDLRKARELLDRAASIAPENYWVNVQKASLSLETGDLALASEELSAAEHRDAKLPGLHLLRARLDKAGGDSKSALAELRAAEALTDADQMRGDILLLRAGIETDLGDYGQAQAALTQAQPLIEPGQLAQARGEIAYAQRDGPAAEGWFREAIQASPQSSVPERKLGETLGAMRQLGESEAAFRRAIAKAKTDEEKEKAYEDIAFLFEKEKRGPEAIAVLEQANAAVPESSSLWATLGAAYGSSGRLDSAAEAYEKSISLKPTALACKTLAALVFENGKDPQRAVALWKQSLSLDPNQPDVKAFLRKYGSR